MTRANTKSGTISTGVSVRSRRASRLALSRPTRTRNRLCGDDQTNVHDDDWRLWRHGFGRKVGSTTRAYTRSGARRTSSSRLTRRRSRLVFAGPVARTTRRYMGQCDFQVTGGGGPLGASSAAPSDRRRVGARPTARGAPPQGGRRCDVVLGVLPARAQRAGRVTRVERSSSCVGISEALLAATSLLGRSGEQKGGRNAPTHQGEGAARILTLRRRAWRAVRAAARERSN